MEDIKDFKKEDKEYKEEKTNEAILITEKENILEEVSEIITN